MEQHACRKGARIQACTRFSTELRPHGSRAAGHDLRGLCGPFCAGYRTGHFPQFLKSRRRKRHAAPGDEAVAPDP